MRIVLTLAGVLLFCASVVTGAGPLIAPAHVAAWMPLTTAVSRFIPADPMSEPTRLLLLGVGFVALARRVRKKNEPGSSLRT